MMTAGIDSRSASNFELKEINANVNKKFYRGKSLFQEYCSNSSIHGIQYVGCKRRTLFEKIWWVASFLLSVYGCGRLIQNIYNKWEETPVIVSFNEKSTPVWQIPFPAVTICPETKVKSEYLNFTDSFHMLFNETAKDAMSEESYIRLLAAAQVCDASITRSFEFNQTFNSECVNLLRNMSVSRDEMLMFCWWQNEGSFCDAFFEETLTEEGFCYTFNSLGADDLLRQEELHKDYRYMTENRTSELWSLETGYKEGANIYETYPIQVLGTEDKAGLSVLLRLYNYDLDFLCRGANQGFKVLLHLPSEYPQTSKRFFRVPLQQEVVILVKPEIMITSEGLRGYSPHRRQCYFNYERRLRYFREYTQQNCKLECITNFTLHTCGCVKFSMPHDNDTEICGANKIQCYTDAEYIQRSPDEMHIVNKKIDFRAKCDCLPACTSVQYNAEISQADFHWKELFKGYKNPLDEFPGIRMSRLTIYFEEDQFIASKRSELYGLTDFLANCGGLLGLFMGVSLLSLVEIIYFCSIRPFTILRSYRTGPRPPSPKLEIKKPIMFEVMKNDLCGMQIDE